jgi:hypothetical protein
MKRVVQAQRSFRAADAAKIAVLTAINIPISDRLVQTPSVPMVAVHL